MSCSSGSHNFNNMDLCLHLQTHRHPPRLKMNCWNQFPWNTQLFFSIVFQQWAERYSPLIQFSICITRRGEVALQTQ